MQRRQSRLSSRGGVAAVSLYLCVAISMVATTHIRHVDAVPAREATIILPASFGSFNFTDLETVDQKETGETAIVAKAIDSQGRPIRVTFLGEMRALGRDGKPRKMGNEKPVRNRRRKVPISSATSRRHHHYHEPRRYDSSTDALLSREASATATMMVKNREPVHLRSEVASARMAGAVIYKPRKNSDKDAKRLQQKQAIGDAARRLWQKKRRGGGGETSGGGVYSKSFLKQAAEGARLEKEILAARAARRMISAGRVDGRVSAEEADEPATLIPLPPTIATTTSLSPPSSINVASSDSSDEDGADIDAVQLQRRQHRKRLLQMHPSASRRDSRRKFKNKKSAKHRRPDIIYFDDDGGERAVFFDSTTTEFSTATSTVSSTTTSVATTTTTTTTTATTSSPATTTSTAMSTTTSPEPSTTATTTTTTMTTTAAAVPRPTQCYKLMAPGVLTAVPCPKAVPPVSSSNLLPPPLQPARDVDPALPSEIFAERKNVAAATTAATALTTNRPMTMGGETTEVVLVDTTVIGLDQMERERQMIDKARHKRQRRHRKHRKHNDKDRSENGKHHKLSCSQDSDDSKCTRHDNSSGRRRR